MRITPGSTGVWMQVVVFDAADEPAEIDLAEIIAAYIEQRQYGSLVDDSETLTLTKVADYSTHAAGNYVYEGDGEHYIAVPDSVVDAADLDVSVAVDSSTQTALGTSYRIEAAGGLTASDVRTALGLASANLDTQLASIAVDADRIPAVPATESTAAAAQTAAEKVAAAYDADGTLTAEAIDEIADASKTLLERAGGPLDAINDMTEDNAGTKRFTAAALANVPTAAIVDAVITAIAGARATVLQGTYDPETQEMQLRRGDDYKEAHGRGILLEVTVPGLDMTGATASWGAKGSGTTEGYSFTGTCTVTTPEVGTVRVLVEFDRKDLTKPAGEYDWDCEIVLAANVITLIEGKVELKETYTALVS